MQRDLERRGVTIVVLGDQILIVMPSALIFDEYSSRIKPSAYSTLNEITAYINNYTKMLVNINAYTADTGSRRVDLALSKEQAQHLARYLYDEGLNARVLHAAGRGGKHLVQKNSTDWYFNMNYRIEITLEKLYV
jgi:outer membrane protein OmpA-like peptidoglycan-associated protein